MSDAPERIWAVTEPNDISADILGEVYAQQIPDGMNGTPVEYVRADRIEELEAAIRNAITLAEQPHYGDRDNALDHCFDAIDVLRDALIGGKDGC